MNRPILIGLIGGAIVIVAVALTFFVDRPPDTPPTAKQPEQQSTANPAPSTAPIAESPPSSASPRSAARPLPPKVKPSFDVVRVNPRGDTVIAGRAAPHSEVTISDGDKVIGKVKADARGEWVEVPGKSLPSGTRELSLTSKLPDSPPISSENKVVLVLPEKGKDIAGRDSGDKPTGPLAMVVRKDDGASVKVLQKPGTSDPEKTAPKPEAAEPNGHSQKPIAEKPAVQKPTAPGKKIVTAAAPRKGRAKIGIASSDLTLDAIDYDETGQLALSGRSPKGNRVQVYINNKPIGAAPADEKGHWRLAPEKKVAAGIHTMRADQIDNAGKVTARVETRFARAEPLSGSPQDETVSVRPGNSLWRIARRVYGRGIRYTVIYEANQGQIRNPDLIYPGQVFHLPQVN